VVLEINGITIHDGQLYAAIYSNEDDYKNERFFEAFVLESSDTTILHELDLPTGEYVVVIYQDTNNNGKLDQGFFGIPKEPFGFTNYTRGAPGNFNKLKTPVNAGTTAIKVTIGKFRM
jgi:uncharacterized protein (DUF2141 family)